MLLGQSEYAAIPVSDPPEMHSVGGSDTLTLVFSKSPCNTEKISLVDLEEK